MSRNVTHSETITCDLPKCRKQLGKTNDHILIHMGHQIATNDTPSIGEVVMPVGVHIMTGVVLDQGAYDFCSYEHAADFLKSLAEEADKKRAERVEELKPDEAPAKD